MPIVEANAVGRPDITSEACSLPEVAGDASIFVSTKNSEELEQAIKDLVEYNQLRNDYIDRGLKNISRFTLPVIAKQYFQIYKSILS